MIKIIEMNIEDLKPYNNNPRYNTKAIEEVANSIREFGFKNPIIVDSDNVIICGHTRLEASKLLGLEVVPVVVANDLSEAQVRAFRIADNKVSEHSEWDYTKIFEEIELLKSEDYDIELTGFKESELEELLEEWGEEEEEVEKEKPELEMTEELLEEHQYIVLTFDNTLDWQVATEVLGIKTVQNKTGKSKGVGRVVKGKELIDKLKEVL
ncbi:MAG: ParB N-terminal domain-containing protein [Cetobacterium sp.]